MRGMHNSSPATQLAADLASSALLHASYAAAGASLVPAIKLTALAAYVCACV